MYNNNNRYVSSLLTLLLLFVAFIFVGAQKPVSAAQLTESSMRLTRVGAGITASASNPILVVFKPASTATEAKFSINWPTTNAFTVDGTNTNHTTSTTGITAISYQGETLTAAGIGATATSVATGLVTYTLADATPGTIYGFFVTGGITNPSAGNAGTHQIVYTTLTSGDVTIDTSQIAVDTVGTNGDQVTVTATVPSTFNFALSGNSIALGSLSTSARTTGNVTVDIDTNANNGWIAWIRSEGGAATLASATTADSISSTNTDACVTATIGAKGYVVDVNAAQGGSSTGVLTVSTEYSCTDAQAGGVISTAYEQIAQSTGQAVDDTLTLTAIVTISGAVEAASDYTDIWEVVGAGNF